jgi:hypothetical protein
MIMLSNSCDDDWNPNLLLYCDQSQSGLPLRSQFKIAGSIPISYGIQVNLAFQSLPGYLFGTSSVGALTGVSGPSGAPSALQLANPNGQGTVWLVTSATTYTSCPAVPRRGLRHGPRGQGSRWRRCRFPWPPMTGCAIASTSSTSTSPRRSSWIAGDSTE